MKNKARSVRLIVPEDRKQKLLRVAAYCRVSSDSADQLESYAAQVKTYQALIGNNPEWELVDIYADEGVTGTKAVRRDDFLRMVVDARRGKIDKIIVKSVSRFARNTEECLRYVRLLKDEGVAIYFEKEGINTAEMSNEGILAINGMTAQMESQSISQNMRWSYKRRMESGSFNTCKAPYGYRLAGSSSMLAVYEKEAAVVRRIFDMFLSGFGKQRIADVLNEEGVPRDAKKRKWFMTTIGYILSNERYMGDVLLQKKYTEDTFPYKSRQNKGEAAMYYVEDSHPPIIDKEKYVAAQLLIERRSKKVTSGNSDGIFHGRLVCPDCGRNFRQIDDNRNKCWICSGHASGKRNCRNIYIREDALIGTWRLALNKLIANRQYVLTPLVSQFSQMQLRASHRSKMVYQIDQEIAQHSEQRLVVARLYSKGILSHSDYTAKTDALDEQLRIDRRQRRKLLENDADEERLSDVRELDSVLASLAGTQAEFDPGIFRAIVEKISPLSNEEISFQLIGGLQLVERTEKSTYTNERNVS